MRDCSIEASSASLPFRLSWNALLMSDINLERYEVNAFAPLLGVLVFRARLVLARAVSILVPVVTCVTGIRIPFRKPLNG
jgi:hypothetical protein